VVPDPSAGSGQGPANPQSLNRYSYVLNNPLRYTDPTGHVGVACPHCELVTVAPQPPPPPQPVPIAPATPCPEWACPEPEHPCWSCAFADIGEFAANVPYYWAEGIASLTDKYVSFVEQACSNRDCVTIVIGSTAVVIAISGAISGQPEIVYIGISLYAAQFQYAWIEYQRGDAESFDVFNAALAGVPGLLPGRQQSQIWEAVLSALGVAREVVCPHGC